ncbi:MAG: hypothetical protein AAGD05_12390, partial [Bacteroidota bacterium]
IGAFSAQDILRKGVIDPDDPGSIDWSRSTPEPEHTAYRAAATAVDTDDTHKIYWIGGSEITYNFDGLAYINGQGVPPANQVLALEPPGINLKQDLYEEVIPMDLRGIAQTDVGVRYIAGGMLNEQQVSDKAFRLELRDSVVNHAHEIEGLPSWTATPNPATDRIRLSGGVSSGKFRIEIFELGGRVLYREERHEPGAWISLEGLPSGWLGLSVSEAGGPAQVLRFLHLP